MCLVFVAVNVHPEWPFVALANRDEYFKRPALPLMHWDTRPGITAGRDEQAGGTWLGCTAQRFAIVTNVRQWPASTGQRSRGALVCDALLAPDLNPWSQTLSRQSHHFSGFNLLVWDQQRLHYWTNRPTCTYRTPGAGIYGLSNGVLDQNWFKVETGKQAFTELVRAGCQDDEAYQAMMLDTTRAPDDRLPDTGLPRSLESALSPRFIALPDYGTRCTTLVWQDRAGRFHIVEWTYTPGLSEPASRAARRALSARP